MRVRLVSLNPVVGDLAGNLKRALESVLAAEVAGAELVVLPELALIGYPPQDLILRAGFIEAAQVQLDDFQKSISQKIKRENFAVVVGTILPAPLSFPEPLLNAAIFIQGDRREVRGKSLIPNYDVFDEKRYFAPSFSNTDSKSEPINFLGEKIGLLICEDSWHDFEANGRKLYHFSPTKRLVEAGATMLVNISASPFAAGKIHRRREMICSIAKQANVAIHYVNMLGANDEIIFDGDAFIVDKNGIIESEKRQCDEAPLTFDSPKISPKPVERIAEIHDAIVCGIRDYAAKTGFKTAVLGVSGGIDSAVVAALAARALGPQNVWGFLLPSKYSSSHSISDAEALAKTLGIHMEIFPIKFLQSTLELALKPFFVGKEPDATEENLQSRLRGIALMAMSNKFGHLLLTTGNKSEYSVGYATLYGDMCGGLAPIGDLFKTDVYALAEYINQQKPLIPKNTITKPPSAELKPGQTDQDSLPEYRVLDRMLHFFVEKEFNLAATKAALLAEGESVDAELLENIFSRLHTAEFKRRQAPPILRLSEKAFGIGRRYPVAKRLSSHT